MIYIFFGWLLIYTRLDFHVMMVYPLYIWIWFVKGLSVDELNLELELIDTWRMMSLAPTLPEPPRVGVRRAKPLHLHNISLDLVGRWFRKTRFIKPKGKHRFFWINGLDSFKLIIDNKISNFRTHSNIP